MIDSQDSQQQDLDKTVFPIASEYLLLPFCFLRLILLFDKTDAITRMYLALYYLMMPHFNSIRVILISHTIISLKYNCNKNIFLLSACMANDLTYYALWDRGLEHIYIDHVCWQKQPTLSLDDYSTNSYFQIMLETHIEYTKKNQNTLFYWINSMANDSNILDITEKITHKFPYIKSVGLL